MKEAIYESVDVIHSKSEPTDPNGATKQFELSANLFKNATKWPKMTQNGPRMTQNDPKWTKNDPKWP